MSIISMSKWPEASRSDNARYQIIAYATRGCPQLVEFLFRDDKPELRDCPEEMLSRAGAFSSGEQILVRFAIDVWSNEGKVLLQDVIHRLDDKNYENVIDSLKLWRHL